MENDNAVVNNEGMGTNTNTKAETKPENNGPTIEELTIQLAQANAEKQKYKNSIDKLTKSNGDLTKQLREKMTAEEQLSAAKAEEDEAQKAYVKELEEYKRKSEAKNRYMSIQKMDADTAEKAAVAEVTGDYEALSTIQQQFTEASLKAKEAEWIKNRPFVNAGVGGEETSVTKEQFDALGYADRVKFKTKYPETYKRYANS